MTNVYKCGIIIISKEHLEDSDMDIRKDIIKTLASMDDATLKVTFNKFKLNGLTDKDIDVIRNMVFHYKLQTDAQFYKAVVTTLGNNLYNRFNKDC